ncbi:MAG: dTDP-4-dehydrorhamnose 3,5-epimerase family protein [Acidimicrobiia bacterium]|nr:dTDP-4-dehydrorhamnose 3,5-epimerase family protein [Acidimicrobiia bacterium]
MAVSNPDPPPAPTAQIVESEVIGGVLIVSPMIFGDDRGRFAETYRRSWFPEGREMVQANCSDKVVNSVVGLHYHLFQSDYWWVPYGRARVVLHDLREGSPTDGATLTLDIGDDGDQGVYIPPGVAHGFAALTDMTITYMVDQYYSPDDELGVAWDDPEVGADWGVSDPVLSKRDQANPPRSELQRPLRPLLGGPVPS